MATPPQDGSSLSEALDGASVVMAATEARIGLTLMLLPEIDGTERLLFVNDAGAEILGRSRDEILSGSPLQLILPEELSAAHERRQLWRASGGLPSWFQTTITRKDGRRVHLHVGMAPLRFRDQEAVLSFFVDVSDTREAQAALARSEARLRQLVESAPEAIWIFDGRRLAYANPALVAMLGYDSAAALLDAKPGEFIHPDDLPVLVARTKELLAGRALGPHEYRVRRQDGRSIVVEAQSIPLERDGETHVLSFGRDVTARKEMEARLAQADRLAMLGAAVAGIAHEINNPLAFTLLALEQAAATLEEAGVDEALRTTLLASLGDAREGAERVAGIVRELRAFSRPPVRKRERLQLSQVLAVAERFAGNELRHRARVTRRFATVRAVDAVGSRLEQVFVNLLINAAQALPEGRVADNEIELRLFDDGPDVVAEVRDNGAGLSAVELPRIFDPFFTSKPQGMGLGLSICREIVESFGGSITAESAVGLGTTFRVRLPAAAPGDVAPAAGASLAVTPPPLERRRLLIIDDEPVVGRVLAKVLQGYDAEHVTSAVAALERMAQAPFDVVLCDLMMPGMTGVQLYTQLERDRPALARRFVFMTGGAFGEEARLFIERTRCLVVDKPFSTPVLLAALEEAAGRA